MNLPWISHTDSQMTFQSSNMDGFNLVLILYGRIHSRFQECLEDRLGIVSCRLWIKKKKNIIKKGAGIHNGQEILLCRSYCYRATRRYSSAIASIDDESIRSRTCQQKIHRSLLREKRTTEIVEKIRFPCCPSGEHLRRAQSCR